eukprot:755915-Hanusia_phi.AAC.2
MGMDGSQRRWTIPQPPRKCGWGTASNPASPPAAHTSLPRILYRENSPIAPALLHYCASLLAHGPVRARLTRLSAAQTALVRVLGVRTQQARLRPVEVFVSPRRARTANTVHQRVSFDANAVGRVLAASRGVCTFAANVPGRHWEQKVEPDIENVPGEQARHRVAVADPTTSEYVPAGQSKHSCVPLVSVYFPAAHSKHRSVSPVENLPGSHAVQAEADPVENFPEGQAEQDVEAGSLENFPGKHRKQLLTPKKPGLHTHAEPSSQEPVLEGHEMHDVAPSCFEYELRLQRVQLPFPGNSLYLPAGHRRQVVRAASGRVSTRRPAVRRTVCALSWAAYKPVFPLLTGFAESFVGTNDRSEPSGADTQACVVIGGGGEKIQARFGSDRVRDQDQQGDRYQKRPTTKNVREESRGI